MEKRPDLTTLTGQEKDALIITLYEVIEGLRQQIRQQAKEIEKLKGQLGNNSSNSQFKTLLCVWGFSPKPASIKGIR